MGLGDKPMAIVTFGEKMLHLCTSEWKIDVFRIFYPISGTFVILYTAGK